MKKILIVLAVIFTSSIALANDDYYPEPSIVNYTDPTDTEYPVSESGSGADWAWRCDLEGEVAGINVGVVKAAGGILSGEADLNCQSISGKHVEKRVKISLIGGGVGAGLSIISSMRVMALDVGVYDPAQMTGEFQLTGSVIGMFLFVGFEATPVAVSVGDGGIKFGMKFSEVQGLGLGLYAQVNLMVIEEIN